MHHAAPQAAFAHPLDRLERGGLPADERVQHRAALVDAQRVNGNSGRLVDREPSLAAREHPELEPGVRQGALVLGTAEIAHRHDPPGLEEQPLRREAHGPPLQLHLLLECDALRAQEPPHLTAGEIEGPGQEGIQAHPPVVLRHAELEIPRLGNGGGALGRSGGTLGRGSLLASTRRVLVPAPDGRPAADRAARSVQRGGGRRAPTDPGCPRARTRPAPPVGYPGRVMSPPRSAPARSQAPLCEGAPRAIRIDEIMGPRPGSRPA